MLETLSNVQSPMWCPGLRRELRQARNLVAYYPFWELDGTRAMDLVSGKYGTLTNMDLATARVTSLYRPALDLDGANNHHVLVSGATGLPTTKGTISLWLNPDTRVTDCWCELSDGTNDNRIVFYYADADQLAVYIKGGGVGANVWVRVGTTEVIIGEWQLMTTTWDTVSGDYHVYRNAVELTPTGGGAPGNPAGINQINFGTYNDGVTNNYNGRLGSAAIYDRIVPVSQIQQLYRKPHALTTPKRLTLPSAAAPPAGNPWNYYAQQSA